MELVLIQAGEFDMGTRESVDELMQLFPDIPAPAEARAWFTWEQGSHRVCITRPFWLGKYPVTVGQFDAFVRATNYRTEAETSGGACRFTGTGLLLDSQLNWRNPGFLQGDDHPVVCVSWNDAQVFCQWLSRQDGNNYRLPTEAEWEYACRAGTVTQWSFGSDPSWLGEYAWYCANSGGTTHPVGQKKPNPWGLYDMHGNVAVYCADRFSKDYYRTSPSDDPLGPLSGEERVLRGAAWLDEVWDTRCGARFWVSSDSRVHDHGFRVARTRCRSEGQVGC